MWPQSLADGAGIQEQGPSPAVYQRLMGMAKQKRVQLILLRFQPRRQQGGLDPVGMAVADQLGGGQLCQRRSLGRRRRGISGDFPVHLLFSGIATGGTVVIAQSFGGGRPDRVRSAIDSLYTAFIRSILPITAAALLLVHPLMTVLRVDPAAWAETRTYLLVVCAGLVGSIGYNLNAGILGGMGNSSTTLLFLAVSTILNIFLDLALVLAVPLGVLGVALGTVIAQLCSWLFGIWYINRRYPQLAIHPFNGIFDRTSAV